MFTRTRFLGALLLGLGLGLLAVAQPAAQQKPRRAVDAILELSDNLDRPDVSARAKKIVEDYDSCDISSVFVARSSGRGGAGIGSAVQAGHRDRIDALVQDWAGPRPPTRAELKAHRKDLLKVARVLQTMAELAPYRMPGFQPREKQQKAEQWRNVSAEFKSVTRELRDTIESRDPAEVRKTAIRLQRTCAACHQLVGV